MTDAEIKKYVDAQIDKALKSMTTTVTVVPSHNPGLERRLSEIELWLAATILTLRESLPESELKQRTAETYSRLKKKLSRRRAQAVSAAIAELEYLLEEDESPEK
jgi:hypothetical protein